MRGASPADTRAAKTNASSHGPPAVLAEAEQHLRRELHADDVRLQQIKAAGALRSGLQPGTANAQPGESRQLGASPVARSGAAERTVTYNEPSSASQPATFGHLSAGAEADSYADDASTGVITAQGPSGGSLIRALVEASGHGCKAIFNLNNPCASRKGPCPCWSTHLRRETPDSGCTLELAEANRNIIIKVRSLIEQHVCQSQCVTLAAVMMVE